MISRDQVQTLIGGTAYSTDGDKIGSIGQVYLDNSSGEPAWVTVKTGLFGSNESFIPLEQAELTNDGVRVPYDKDRVKNAPNIETDRELSEQEEDQLYSYYGLHGTTSGYETTGTTDTTTGTTADYDTTTTSGYRETAGTTGLTDTTTTSGYRETAGTTGLTDTTDTAGTYETRSRAEGYDTSGPTTDDAMTRSEERVRAGTEQVAAGTARLRKYVVTDSEQVTVPVTREEVRVEREPITDANYDKAMDGPVLSEEEHEVVLNEERPVVTTEAVPVERVRLTKDQIQDQETVTADVRKEVIDTDVDGPTTVAGTTTRRDDDDASLGDKARGLADKAKDKLS